MRAGRHGVRSARSTLASMFPGRPDPDLWVFGAAVARSYSDNSQSLFEHVLAENPEIDARWAHFESEPRLALCG